jgi:hypothetical protein
MTVAISTKAGEAGTPALKSVLIFACISSRGSAAAWRFKSHRAWRFITAT